MWEGSFVRSLAVVSLALLAACQQGSHRPDWRDVLETQQDTEATLYLVSGKELSGVIEKVNAAEGFVVLDHGKGYRSFVSMADIVVFSHREQPPPAIKPPPPPPGEEIIGGIPFEPGKYQTRLLAKSTSRHVWGMDDKEIEWVKDNWEEILEKDITLRLDSSGRAIIAGISRKSVLRARGLFPEDIILKLNQEEISSPTGLKESIVSNLERWKRFSTFIVTIERRGKVLVLEYRPLPKSRRR